MTIWVWGGFVGFVLLLLALDLGLLNRNPHAIKAREALLWTAFWIALALGFNVLLYFGYSNQWLGLGVSVGLPMSGTEAALEFFTAYVVEKSLSLDNIFVIAIIFGFFGVPLKYQHKVLFWGIIGALVMRGVMIVGGIALLHRFEWLTYVFAVMLLGTAAKLMVSQHEAIEPEKNPLVRLTRRVVPVVDDVESGKFFTRVNGQFAVTTMFLVLMLIESTDLLFAIDSIPACFAVTNDPFLVFTSNIFAILGLRSLYFALAAIMDTFRYLKQSLVFLLAFVGVKMLLVHTDAAIPTWVSLSFIAGILGVGIAASIIAMRRESHQPAPPLTEPLPEEE